MRAPGTRDAARPFVHVNDHVHRHVDVHVHDWPYTIWALTAALLLRLLPGCLGQGEFRCTSHDQCGAAGLCEPNGRCSIPATNCDSGRRYVALAGSSSGACVTDACPENPIVALTAGAAHACFLRDDRRRIYCWGANADGQLGDGTTTTRSTPVPVQGLTDVKAIAAGERHTCAVLLDGTVYCWGANTDGQISAGDRTSRPTPVRVPGVGHAIDVAAGSVATCAVIEDGSALCWGSNDYGQLGDGSGAPQPGPIEVFALRGIRTIAAHWQHFCALRSDESLWCWGNNTHGQIGTGSSIAQTQPARVVGVNGVTSASVGLQHTCAATRADGLWCWGDGSGGQLGAGDGTNAGVNRPARVPSIGDPVAVTVGAQHSCALRVGGGAWCWGNNLSGQLGDGTADGIDVPVPASGLDHLVEMVAGEKFTCARRDEGTIWCWGDNHAGQLGLGSPVLRALPEPVAGLANVASVAAGGAHTCAITRGTTGSDPEIQCWGANPAGQLGDNRNVDRARPAPLKVPLPAAQVAAGGSHTCARAAGDGRVLCWGRGNAGQVGPLSSVDARLPVLALATPASALATGGAHTCALLAGGDGSVLCWGAGGDGQLGDGTGTDHATPAPVPGLKAKGDIAAGDAHTCVIGGDDAIYCWGRDDYGQLGDGGTERQLGPIAVPLPGAGGPAVTAVVAGGQHSCARDGAGQIFCWGRGDRGQLGSGSLAASARPAPVTGVPAATAIAAGGAHTCAVTSGGGTVWCWGANDQGQLGNGTETPTGDPSEIPGLTQIAGVSAGDNHTCAWRADGPAWCWGGNTSGQLGDGVTLQASTPQLDRVACP